MLQSEQCRVQGSTGYTCAPDTAHASKGTNGRDARREPSSLLCPLSASPPQSDAEPWILVQVPFRAIRDDHI